MPTRFRLGALGALMVAGLLATPAYAAVVFDPTCSLTPGNASGACGFVGKGDVQLALGYNNRQLQAAAPTLAFTYGSAATQAGTQSGTQAGSQVGTELVTCYNVNPQGRVTAFREGNRDGDRSGGRVGTRDGTRSGTVASAVHYTARNHSQFDGFLLTSLGTAGFTPAGDFEATADWSWGAWSWGAWSWGQWTVTSENTNENQLDNCLAQENKDNIVVEVLAGAITSGSVTPGAWTPGDVTPTGSVSLFVEGVALPY